MQAKYAVAEATIQIAGMRGIGKFLLWLGAVVGGATGLALLGHAGLAGVPWLVNVGLAKLGILTSLGLMGGGAVGLRLANRRQAERLTRGASDA